MHARRENEQLRGEIDRIQSLANDDHLNQEAEPPAEPAQSGDSALFPISFTVNSAILPMSAMFVGSDLSPCPSPRVASSPATARTFGQPLTLNHPTPESPHLMEPLTDTWGLSPKRRGCPAPARRLRRASVSDVECLKMESSNRGDTPIQRLAKELYQMDSL